MLYLRLTMLAISDVLEVKIYFLNCKCICDLHFAKKALYVRVLERRPQIKVDFTPLRIWPNSEPNKGCLKINGHNKVLFNLS